MQIGTPTPVPRAVSRLNPTAPVFSPSRLPSYMPSATASPTRQTLPRNFRQSAPSSSSEGPDLEQLRAQFGVGTRQQPLPVAPFQRGLIQSLQPLDDSSSESLETLSQLHRQFNIGTRTQPIAITSTPQAPYSWYQQPAILPPRPTQHSPSPSIQIMLTSPRAAARQQTRDLQTNLLQIESPVRRRSPSMSPSASPRPDEVLDEAPDASFGEWDDPEYQPTAQQSQHLDEQQRLEDEQQGIYNFTARTSYYANIPHEPSKFTAHRHVARSHDEITLDIRHILDRCSVYCRHCNALHWPDEASNRGANQRRDPAQAIFVTCCDNGRVPFNPPQRSYPPALRRLLTATAPSPQDPQRQVRMPRSRDFLQHIRHYNNAFSFTSLGASVQHVRGGGGPPTFRIQGALHHLIGSLLPPPDRAPAFLQIYMWQGVPAQEQQRHRSFHNLNQGITFEIATVLNDINPFARFLANAAEQLRDNPTTQVQLKLNAPPRGDQRRYNKPVDEDFAAIIPEGQEGAAHRDIIVKNRDGQLHRVYETSPYYLPLRYPLLFPFGELGWHLNMPAQGFVAAPTAETFRHDMQEEQREGDEAAIHPRRGRGAGGSTRVSPKQWFAGLFHSHRDIFNPVLHAGQLLMELAVDGASVVEQERIRWIYYNQKQLRADVYQGVIDYLASDAVAEDNRTIGRRIVLPPSFQGSPRNLSRHYQDAMAIARKHGGPDLFVTFTCNPNWIEIRRELAPGQTAAERPDLCARVFELKRRQLMDELLKRDVFGRVVASCSVTEFQKRGLPHTHTLLILARDDKLRTATEVDAIISAEIPDPERDPILFDVISTCMLHRKCGRGINDNAMCMQNTKKECHAHFPKRFTEETRFDDDSFVVYKRSAEGPRIRKGYDIYDNRDVVPYSPYLSKRLNAHINVEVAASIEAFKYLYKYVFKGPDRISVTVASNAPRREVDEVKEHIDARWLGPPEAMWHLFGYKMYYNDPPVMTLQIHEENQQSVTWDEEGNRTIETVAEAASRTTLTEYFLMNLKCKQDVDSGILPAPNSLDILYQDFPVSYVWTPKTKQWTTRKRESGQIGRVAFVSPRQRERYYLRLLLTYFPGFTSFEDVRTYEGAVYGTYREACLARGILSDDFEWHETLREAGHFQSGRSLRNLFFYIVFHCNPSDPLALWMSHRHTLSDDCKHRLQQAPYNVSQPIDAEAYNFALCELRRLLQSVSKDLGDVGLPVPTYDYLTDLSEEGNRMIRDELIYDQEGLQQQIATETPQLNADQKRAHEAIYASVQAGDGGVFFLLGSGGTGKTFVQNLTLARVRADGEVALAVATTGIAATLLSGGQTAHSRFGIPVEDIDATSTCNIRKQSIHGELMRRTKLILWDEAVMAHKHVINCVDRSLRDLRDDSRPFGGITVCFCGDFRQILPVVPGGSRAQIVNACIKFADCWPSIIELPLRINMRLQREGLTRLERRAIKEFAGRLLKIGRTTGDGDEIQWPAKDVVDGNDMLGLARAIFPNLARQRHLSDDYLASGVLLAARNDIVDGVNDTLLAQMPAREEVRLSRDRPKDPEDGEHYSSEYLNSLRYPGLAHHRFCVKIGCPVILLRNLNAQSGLCNGTRMRVSRINQRTIECVILSGPHAGNIEMIPRIPMASPQRGQNNVEFVREQFPLKLAFAMTINKAQGQSLRRVGLLLNPPVFSHGQLYVGLSRVTHPDGIRMAVPPTTRAAREGWIKNVVFTDVFGAMAEDSSWDEDQLDDVDLLGSQFDGMAITD